MPAGKNPSVTTLHPRNIHNDRYDLVSLCDALPELKPFVFTNQYGSETIDFSNPAGVKALNKALLKKHYAVNFWDIPDGFLCPPIPGRADYLHYLADLLLPKQKTEIKKNSGIHILDIGTGANLIYPLIGTSLYDWQFVATEINVEAFQNAQDIMDKNPSISSQIELRKQDFGHRIFKGIVREEERFEAILCNPPFHKSKKEAQEASLRKARNIYKNDKIKLNFGGGPDELWCPGGEFSFVKNMVKESLIFQDQILWFTCMISKSEHMSAIEKVMERNKVNFFKWVEMRQGNKKSRFIAWTFQSKKSQVDWMNNVTS